MNKIAVLIMCHKNKEQVLKFINQFNPKKYDIFVHIDVKYNDDFSLFNKDNVYVISNRVDVKWGTIEQVDATTNLLTYATAKGEYLFYWLCSGQDLLIKSSNEIYSFLEQSKDFNFITKISISNDKVYGRFMKRNELYYPKFMLKNKFISKVIKNIYMILTGGRTHTFRIFKRKFSKLYDFLFSSQWFCINGETTKYILKFLNDNPSYYKNFSSTICADECFFSTIVYNSVYKSTIKDGLTYIDWSEGNRSPKTFRMEDYDKIISSNKFIARKFDVSVDNKIVEKIISNTIK